MARAKVTPQAPRPAAVLERVRQQPRAHQALFDSAGFLSVPAKRPTSKIKLFCDLLQRRVLNLNAALTLAASRRPFPKET
jgi:hypothetical protein|tara:strand:- start:2475 stop:2714 length:240 start_codon:yes stop_codon:yes gene_type:complete